MDIDTVRRAFHAFAEADTPAVMAIMAPDIVWVEPEGSPWGGTYRGLEEVLGLFETAGAALGPSWRVEPDRFIKFDDGVAVLGRHTGLRASGEQWAVPFAMFFTMEGGTVTHFRHYEDTALLQRILREERPVAGATA